MIECSRPGRVGCAVLLAALGTFSSSQHAWADGGAIGVRSGAIDTAAEPNELATLGHAAAPRRLYLIQLDGPLSPERADRLKAAGIVLGDYLPENSYVVQLNRIDRRALAGVDFVRWAGTFRRDWKLAPDLGRRAFQTPERVEMAARGEAAVEITLFRGAPADATLAAIGRLNGAAVHWVREIGGNPVLSATVRSADIPALADLENVQFIEDAPELTLRNGTNRWIVQSNLNGVFPFYSAGIHGEGQIIGIVDTQLDRNHCAFRDDVNNTPGPLHRKIAAYNTGFGTGSHGTHVSGTAVGDAGADDNNRGVAYLARLVYHSIPPFTEDDVKSRLELHHGQGARIHTNSWGDDSTTAYNGLARGIDVFSYEHEDDLVLFAVTNTSSLKNPENAKNLLAVGASQDTPNQGSHCFGGAGPTGDGRRKPEIYAPGCSTISASAGSGCLTTTNSGTSMACPAVAGAAMLARQYFNNGYYPTGAAVPEDGFTPSGALVKAVLLNSAVDMTGIAGYPSNSEGWGRVLLDNAVYFPGDTRKMFVDEHRNADGLTTGESRAYLLAVTGGGVSLRLTLVWTDPPASVNVNPAFPAAINDLNLEVTGPNAEVYRGNWFSGGQSAAAGAFDSKNNVEHVYLSSPATGYYTARVIGTSVIQGPGNPFRQGYAVVASGDFVLAADCNANEIPDGLDLSGGTSQDCQNNAVPDECDVAFGTSADANSNGTPDECDPPPPPFATVIGVSSLKLHAVRGSQALAINHFGRVDDANVTSECRLGGINELRIRFDTALQAGVTTLAGGAVTVEEQRTGDPGAGTSAGYSPSGYAGTISTATSAGDELVLSFSPALPNAVTYRFTVSGQVTSVLNQSVEVRALLGDVIDSGAVNGSDRSVIVGVWTGSGYSTKTDVDLSGSTDASDRSMVVGAWTGPENTAP